MDKEYISNRDIFTKVTLCSLSSTLISLVIADKFSKKFWFYPHSVPKWFNNLTTSLFLLGMTVTSVSALYPLYVDIRRLIKHRKLV